MMERVVLIDLGSNAVRFALAGVIPGRAFRIFDEARVQTRLAAGRRGALPLAGVAATVAAVRRFLARVDDGRPLRVVAAATSAVRDARNAHRLIGRLRRVADIEVEVLGVGGRGSPRRHRRVEQPSIPGCGGDGSGRRQPAAHHGPRG